MSEKSIAERLQVKPGRRLAVIGAPPALDEATGVADRRAPAGQADIVLLFARDRADLASSLPKLLAAMNTQAIFWLAYPKLTSSLSVNLDRDLIRMPVSLSIKKD